VGVVAIPFKRYGELLTNQKVKNSRKENMPIKPGPKPIAKSTGKPDKRRRDNKETPKNTPELKPNKHKKGN